jgi:phospholipase C
MNHARTLFLAATVALCGALSLRSAEARTLSHPVDRIFIIMMENHSFDEVIGRTDGSGYKLLTPFITQLAANDGLATLSFGVTGPSLGNYLSFLAGDYLGVHDDLGSCYAKPPPKLCYGFDIKNLVDELEAAGITWSAYMQSMPHDGFLGQQYPNKGDGLYRQKHNPFPYFKDIATNRARMQLVKTFTHLPTDLSKDQNAPRFMYIVPDECHDMHGSTPFCPKFNELLVAGDNEVQKLVNEITSSGAFTQNSVIFLTWDEGDFSNQGCCDSPFIGGGHIPTIVISGMPGAPLASATPYNHYSVLATIEDVWNLAPLGYTKDTKHVKPLFDLIR